MISDHNKQVRKGHNDLKAVVSKETADKEIVDPASDRVRRDPAVRSDKALAGVSERSRKTASKEPVHPRGRLGYMQYFNGFIGCVLVLFAVIHAPYPMPLAWLPYLGAAILAFISLKPTISMRVARVLAVATTALMFFFFAYFFVVVPKLAADWYMGQEGWAAVCRILSAFAMIPLLSEYSCRLKADCVEAREARRTSFFSVPSHINPESR